MQLVFYDKVNLGIGLILLLIVIVASVVLLRRQTVGRKRKLTLFVLICSCAVLVLQFYSAFIEPNLLVVTKYDLSQSKLNLKVAVIADIHLGPYRDESYVKKLVDRINSEKPDLVFLLGDYIYIDKISADGLKPLKNLNVPLGVYAVLGNHDYGIARQTKWNTDNTMMVSKSEYITARLQEFNIKVLLDDGVNLSHNGKKLYIAGLHDYWTNVITPINKAFAKADKDVTYRILLSHNPDIIMNPDSRQADLVLSGHTHGGQVSLPLIGPLNGVPDALGSDYARGLFTFGNTKLLITSGVGEMGPRNRLFNAPEIVIIEL